ncbi:MAG: hypothetical protein A3F15_00595 [Candidatus Wildermuthbacteria bacterium RIFCSPHIGHO2_12_FULL_40_12]|uniref:Uncharacterized protein n=1 Tax=Candidatus Wildermuthbacteria bacterium RIFCSPHIGHO2_12_FULL_40_12 TaxID=1802457 RepID=A0A1G2RDU1_9BACT|nr:MAG: hypothetical protein A3F15_00595 [Candidatus Wildermuthbacteria bacterium RIFCSPHIGHO2_12_FULL_40_12]
MEFTKARERYYVALYHLGCGDPFEDVSAVCPHLCIDEAIELLEGGYYVCCPPLRVIDDYQVVYFDKQNARLVRLSAGRCHEYSGFKTDHYSLFGDSGQGRYVCRRRAQEFAKNNWAKGLISDNWQAVYLVKFRGANNRETWSYPTVNYGNNGKETMIDSTFDPIIGQEMIGDRDEYVLGHYLCCHAKVDAELQFCPHCGKDEIISHFFARKDKATEVKDLLDRLVPSVDRQKMAEIDKQLHSQL